MKVTLDGKEYEVNLAKAKELGLCKEIEPQITSFFVGDIFKAASSCRVMIIQSQYRNPTYTLAGLSGLELFSNISHSLYEKEMLEYLNKHRYKFLGNINKGISELINKCSN